MNKYFLWLINHLLLFDSDIWMKLGCDLPIRIKCATSKISHIFVLLFLSPYKLTILVSPGVLTPPWNGCSQLTGICWKCEAASFLNIRALNKRSGHCFLLPLAPHQEKNAIFIFLFLKFITMFFIYMMYKYINCKQAFIIMISCHWNCNVLNCVVLSYFVLSLQDKKKSLFSYCKRLFCLIKLTKITSPQCHCKRSDRDKFWLFLHLLQSSDKSGCKRLESA